MNVLWSWFHSFKTDLETYIYITLQEAIYDINSAFSAAALVTYSQGPSLRTSYSNQGVSRTIWEDRAGNGCFALSLSPSSTTRVLQDCLTFCPTQKYLDDMKAWIISLM